MKEIFTNQSNIIRITLDNMMKELGSLEISIRYHFSLKQESGTNCPEVAYLNFLLAAIERLKQLSYVTQICHQSSIQ